MYTYYLQCAYCATEDIPVNFGRRSGDAGAEHGGNLTIRWPHIDCPSGLRRVGEAEPINTNTVPYDQETGYLIPPE